MCCVLNDFGCKQRNIDLIKNTCNNVYYTFPAVTKDSPTNLTIIYYKKQNSYKRKNSPIDNTGIV